MEASVLAAEARLTEARSRTEDGSIVSDATALQLRLAELETAQNEVDRLYARWAELEAKRR
jgi:ATP-binding cassette subfamily F protein uup